MTDQNRDTSTGRLPRAVRALRHIAAGPPGRFRLSRVLQTPDHIVATDSAILAVVPLVAPLTRPILFDADALHRIKPTASCTVDFTTCRVTCGDTELAPATLPDGPQCFPVDWHTMWVNGLERTDPNATAGVWRGRLYAEPLERAVQAVADVVALGVKPKPRVQEPPRALLIGHGDGLTLLSIQPERQIQIDVPLHSSPAPNPLAACTPVVAAMFDLDRLLRILRVEREINPAMSVEVSICGYAKWPMLSIVGGASSLLAGVESPGDWDRWQNWARRGLGLLPEPPSFT